jgi:pimeloyl-ACP methyl ester carboxylesterase
MEWLTVSAGGGRELEVLVEGDPAGFPLVFHGGTPTAATRFPALDRVATRLGAAVISWSRPGYAKSTPQPGRTVADVARDAAAVLDEIGAGDFAVIGWSGGGPHALACAALLAPRCRAAATLAGVAPYPADGLAWLAGMAPENVAEFGAALSDPGTLADYLTGFAGELAEVSATQVAQAFGELVPDVDQAALTGEFAETFAETMRRAVSTGIEGWLEDDLAFVGHWGFDVADIACPVTVWQGELDRMVPFDHGRWLAARIPAARPRLLPGEGHLSLVAQLDRIVEELLRQAR